MATSQCKTHKNTLKMIAWGYLLSWKQKLKMQKITNVAQLLSSYSHKQSDVSDLVASLDTNISLTNIWKCLSIAVFTSAKTCVKHRHGQRESVSFVSITAKVSSNAVNKDTWMPNETTWISSGNFIDWWYGYDQSDMPQSYLPLDRSGQMKN